jgi:type II secretory pathway pseudopilin PulG
METSSDPAGVKKINWRQFGKHWIVVFILAILAAFVIWGMLQAGPWLKRLQDWRAARALQSQLEELYRNDKYGGTTPEETFDMFITALEKGDVELASKYFVIDKQENWRQSLAAIKSQPAIYDEMVAEMKFARDNAHQKTEGEFAWFSYTMPGEKIGEQLVFEKIFSRWKINVL